MFNDSFISPLGYLIKQGHRVKNWKRRFFVLKNGLLSYYESQTTQNKIKGSISVSNASIVIFPVERFLKEFVFAITSSTGDVLVLQADTIEEFNDWVSLLQQVSTSALYLSGDLFKLQTFYRKRYKQFYFILSGSHLAWYSSEANAAAPGGSSG